MKKIVLFLIIFMFLVKNNLFARDYSVENNGSVSVIISRNNLNRIKVFNDRIKDITANNDELIIKADSTNGEIFIKPNVFKDIIEIFIKTENNATYKLILKIKNDIPAQQVFLNREETTLKNFADADYLRREKLKLIDENQFFDFDEKYQISAINLIRAMSSMAQIRGFNVVNRKEQEILDYDNFKVYWLYSYMKNDKSGISGEIALITNISNKEIILNEEIFFRHGIRAVRLEKLTLRPNESCHLYFVGGE